MSRTFNVELSCDNDAFAEDPGSEIAGILKKVAAGMSSGAVIHSASLYDTNGNRVGKAWTEGDWDD